MIPIRGVSYDDEVLLKRIDELTRRFYGIDDKEVRVGFVGGMLHADRPLKDKDVIICVENPKEICVFAKELYDLGFDKVEISENPYEAAWALVRLWFGGVEYQVQVHKLTNIFQRIKEFPLSIQKKAVVLKDGVCTLYLDQDAITLENINICYVNTSGHGNWKSALDKYKAYYPSMKFVVDTYSY